MIKRLKNIKIQNLQRSFWIFVLITVMLGALFQVGAQVNPNIQATNEYIEWPKTPSQNSLLTVYQKEEVDTIIGSDSKCAGKVNSYLGGVLPGLLSGMTELLIDDPFLITCASTTANKGDLETLNYLLHKQDKGLSDSVMAINGQLLDQRPASGANYIQGEIYALQNLGKVSAQDNNTDNQDLGLYYPGLGYDLLRPVQAFWGWSVTIVYSILILVIIFVALGIMFRANLSGGIAVALQSSIPNIALAMILVPLSYAITGLFIDGITVGVNATHTFLVGPGSPGRGVYEEEITKPPSYYPEGIAGDYVNRGLHADDLKVSWLYSGITIARPIGEGVGSFGAAIGGASSSIGLVSTVGSFIQSVLGQDWIIGIISFLLALLLLVTGLRIFWKLIKKYMMFITMPLISPFVFAGVALPGGGMNTVMWYAKQMGSATLAYVVTYAMILLSLVFSSSYFLNQLPQAGITTYVPPLTAIESLLYGFSNGVNQSGAASSFIDFMFALVAFSIYMLIPKTLDQIDEALGVGKTPEFLADVFQSTKDSIGLGKVVGTNVAATPRRITQARQTALNLIDRAKGIKPGEVGSILSQRRARLQSQLAEVERQRAGALEEGRYIQARNLLNKENAIKRQLGNLDTAAGGDGKTTEGANKLEAEIAWGASKGLLVMDGATISALRAGGGKLMNGSIKIKSEVPLFPVANAPVGRKAAISRISSTVGSRIPGEVKAISYRLIKLFNKIEDGTVAGVPKDGEFTDYAIGKTPQAKNIFKLKLIDETLVSFYINGLPETIGAIDEDGQTIKLSLVMEVHGGAAGIDNFIKLIGEGKGFKTENEVQIKLIDVFGKGITATSNKVSFAVQPQFTNIPGLRDNPIV
ncbi:hypothetical protein KC678_00515 [Candidatus Dojkabacteria bacterium]|uniref:Uncharacterized protein n=1 Tax=Candidatus Dojkabacteria bacterium TaxID=2099670 RepID=A0A955L098_9BACT|nr:hypothetical protein [Candidatus Dojkabacteria bacterium]